MTKVSGKKVAKAVYFAFWGLAAAVFVVTGLWATETKRRIYTVEDRASYDRPAAYALYGYYEEQKKTSFAGRCWRGGFTGRRGFRGLAVQAGDLALSLFSRNTSSIQFF